jgi:elongation factor P
VYKADEKFDTVTLERKDCTYSYFADPMYVFMDAEYNQYEVEADNMSDALPYLDDGMPLEVVFYEGKAISCRSHGQVAKCSRLPGLAEP